MGRFGESYGEDASLVSAMGAAYTKGIQKEYSCFKKKQKVWQNILWLFIIRRVEFMEHTAKRRRDF